MLDQKVVVLDKSTSRPISNVDVSIRTLRLVTDSTGFCHFHAITGNMNKRTVKSMKEGYKNFEIEIELTDDFVVYRQRIDSTYEPVNYFAARKDTLLIYMERK